MNNIPRILEHLLFWTIYWGFISLSSGLYDLQFARISLFHLSHLPLTMLSTYLFVYRVLPLYFEKRWVQFGIYALAVLAGVVVVRRISMQYIQFPLFYANSDYTFTFFNWYRIVGNFLQVCTVIGLVAGLKFFRDWKRSKDKIEALSLEKRAAELSFLRAQIHPHFLFNTLNSIYYESVKKSDAASDLIIQLSDLLRFTLYQCRDPYILISVEIQLIQNYIALQQSRYGERLTINLEIKGETFRKIPPLICFSLIENAFKHGASDQMDQGRIDILFEADADWLRLQVRNPIAEVQEKDVLGASKGIGLENVTRQLELLFENNYTLQTEKRSDSYVSTLEMPIL